MELMADLAAMDGIVTPFIFNEIKLVKRTRSRHR